MLALQITRSGMLLRKAYLLWTIRMKFPENNNLCFSLKNEDVALLLWSRSLLHLSHFLFYKILF